MADLTEARINVAALKRVDPYLNNILDTATHVALYTFNTVKNEWAKTDIEGALFVYSRTGQPFHGILIMNRLNTNNLVEPVTKDLDLQLQEPFLLYKNSTGKIYGIWFYEKSECTRLSGLLQNIVKETESKKLTPKRTGGVDIFGMLSRAQEDFNMNKVPGLGSENLPQPPPPVTEGTFQSVVDFFAKAKGQQKENVAQPPGMFSSTPRAIAPIGHSLAGGDGHSKPFLQRLMSNPAHSVEHIEKQQRSTTPMSENVASQPTKTNTVTQQKPKHEMQTLLTNPVPTQVTQVPNVQNVQRQKPKVEMQPMLGNITNTPGIQVVRPKADWSPKAAPVDLSTKLNFHPIGSSTLNQPIPGSTFYNSNIAVIDAGLSDLSFRESSTSDVETPKKPALMLPSMFTTGNKSEARNGISSQVTPAPVAKLPTAHEVEQIRPEPLTRNQLLQSVNYLLKNDPDFVNKLHEAYVKSFSEMLSS